MTIATINPIQKELYKPVHFPMPPPTKADRAPMRMVISQPIFSLPGWINLAITPMTAPIKRYQRTSHRLILHLRQILFLVHMPTQLILVEHDVPSHESCSALSSRISRHYTACSPAESILLLFQDFFQDALNCVAPLALDKRENDGHKLANHAAIQTQLGEATSKAR